MEPKDHDVLITIATQVDRLISDVKDVRADIADVKSDLANRVALLENEKVSKVDFDKAEYDQSKVVAELGAELRESRKIIDFLSSRYWWLVGVGSTVSFLFSLVVGYILTHLK